ncbi:hypothetical protein COLO4_05944 [Corchorus olitorius]|uniref:Uncharacterized protein n=1 Tax=Corchorus olitorius TaxID=93759 RepID=A0A1R3KPH6_9ROSI|nr:hypothetical protein COLO4_05944 [Corchorus olitorius]
MVTTDLITPQSDLTSETSDVIGSSSMARNLFNDFATAGEEYGSHSPQHVGINCKESSHKSKDLTLKHRK